MLTVFRMRALPPKYQTLPCQGMRCHIEGLQPPEGTISWTKKSLMSMMNCLANIPIDAKIVVSIVNIQCGPFIIGLLQVSEYSDIRGSEFKIEYEYSSLPHLKKSSCLKPEDLDY